MGPGEPPGQGDPIARGPLRAPRRESQGDPIVSPSLRLEKGSQGDPIISPAFGPPADLLRGDPLGRSAFGAVELLLLLLLLLLLPADVPICLIIESPAIILCSIITPVVPLNKIISGPSAILNVIICDLILFPAIAPIAL